MLFCSPPFSISLNSPPPWHSPLGMRQFKWAPPILPPIAGRHSAAALEKVMANGTPDSRGKEVEDGKALQRNEHTHPPQSVRQLFKKKARCQGHPRGRMCSGGRNSRHHSPGGVPPPCPHWPAAVEFFHCGQQPGIWPPPLSFTCC